MTFASYAETLSYCVNIKVLFQHLSPHLPGSEVAEHFSHETVIQKIYMGKTDVYMEEELLLITAIIVPSYLYKSIFNETICLGTKHPTIRY